MSNIRFRTSEASKLISAYGAHLIGVAEGTHASFQTARGSVFFQLEWLEGNRWAVWHECWECDVEGAFGADTVEQSRLQILVDDAGVFPVELSPRAFFARQLQQFTHQGGRCVGCGQ